ncbi:methyltransferase domain-containing protein [Verrucomicrobiota bacterium sgz303538]
MIERWNKGVADDCMPEEMLVSTLEKVRRHPWWKARAALALEVLKRNEISPPASVFDVGCGWGVNLTALEKAGYRVSGLDISPQILSLIDSPQRRLIEADLMQPLPDRVEPADAILALDVIEHLDDDRYAVQQMAQLLKPGGIAVISVPAQPELYSDFDAVQGHRRRYLPESLQAAFDKTGLKIRTIFWWGAWMVPILRRTRASENKQRDRPARTYADYLNLPPWPGPQIFAAAFALEKARAISGSLNTGTSLFAVAERICL